MARETRTPEEFRKAANDAEQISNKLREVADLIDKNPNIDGILVHGGSVLNHHLPKCWVWANGLLAEFEEQAKAISEGRMSKAEYDKQRHQVYSKPPTQAPRKRVAKKNATKKKRK